MHDDYGSGQLSDRTLRLRRALRRAFGTLRGLFGHGFCLCCTYGRFGYDGDFGYDDFGYDGHFLDGVGCCPVRPEASRDTLSQHGSPEPVGSLIPCYDMHGDIIYDVHGDTFYSCPATARTQTRTPHV